MPVRIGGLLSLLLTGLLSGCDGGPLGCDAGPVRLLIQPSGTVEIIPGEVLRVAATASTGCVSSERRLAFDWSSNDPAVATVEQESDSTILVRGIGPGVTSIRGIVREQPQAQVGLTVRVLPPRLPPQGFARTAAEYIRL